MALHLCLLIGQFVVLHFKTVGKEIITFLITVYTQNKQI